MTTIEVDTEFVTIVGHLDMNAVAAFGSAALAGNDD